jgi:hypothetical protein
MLRSLFFLAASIFSCCVLAAQSPAAPPSAVPMPVDRAVDSYLIYSGLLPLGETAGDGWPHQLWLVEDTTITVVQPDKPCQPQPGSGDSAAAPDSSMNPHNAVHPSPDRRQDYIEILDDFDLHCHERLTLDPTAWKLPVPVRLLTPAEQHEFQSTRFSTAKDSTAAAKYNGAPALYGFSQVYFNARHTVAIVYATHWCGSLCGEGFWIALALENGQWKSLNWSSLSWIS